MKLKPGKLYRVPDNFYGAHYFSSAEKPGTPAHKVQSGLVLMYLSKDPRNKRDHVFLLATGNNEPKKVLIREAILGEILEEVEL